VPQRLQVVLVVIAAHHHEGVATIKDGRDVRNPDAV
jgi:hypothetical protein